MKTLFRTISFSLFFLIVLIILLNISNSIAIETSFLNIRANVGFFILLSAVLSTIATLLFIMSMNPLSRATGKAVKKQLDDIKLSHEIESSKVNRLEAKIQTLEEALKIATKK